MNEIVFDKKSTQEEQVYSKLTGEILDDKNLINSPTFCIQIPNGTDGARPQAGLTEAGVVFEAIAEAGITRFAAIFENPSSGIIGPIRSLRTYYLDWDIPFDCTIVHAGGASDAIEALRAGGYRDLDENNKYMYRGTYGVRRWNNLFTTANYLKQFNTDSGYNSSDVHGFARMTPEEAERDKAELLAVNKLVITKPTDQDTSEIQAKISSIRLNFSSSSDYNVKYNYNTDTNTYTRSYDNGMNHEVYECSAEDLGRSNPENACSLTVVSPSVVIAMIVQEKRASDNYHEDISSIGTGDAYVFQNGSVVKGSWSKNSRADQIKFFNEEGNEMKLAPGQTFVSAVPNYGSVDY